MGENKKKSLVRKHRPRKTNMVCICPYMNVSCLVNENQTIIHRMTEDVYRMKKPGGGGTDRIPQECDMGQVDSSRSEGLEWKDQEEKGKKEENKHENIRRGS